MMNTLNLEPYKYLSSVSLHMSLPFCTEETVSETIPYWFQLADVHILVTQCLNFFHICFSSQYSM